MNIQIQKVHERLLEIAKATAVILENHNIPYSMAYGTMLGAIRNHGFIPWDDDLDFFLFDEDYDEASVYLRLELPREFFVEDEKSEPLYFHSWSHVKDLHSYRYCEKYAHDDIYKHKGLFIDLHRLKKMRFCDLNEYVNSENYNYIMRRKRLNLISDDEYKLRLEDLKRKELEAADNPIKSEEEIYALINPYKRKYILAEDVFPLKKFEFEDTSFYGMEKYDKILTDFYGDYMTPPPASKRRSGRRIIEVY